MRKTRPLSIVLSSVLCFTFFMDSCNFSNKGSNSTSVKNNSMVNQIPDKNRSAMNQITPELFEPQLKAFAKAVCEETFPPFVMSQCTRRGDIILQDKKNNAGKHGSCKFHVTLIKEKKNGKLKDRGSADIIVKGIYNINPDGTLSEFIQEEVTFENINVKGRYKLRENIKIGATYLADQFFELAPSLIPLL